MWAEPGSGTWRHISHGCNKGHILPHGSYEKTGHQMIWLNFKRTCIDNPCSSAKSAEIFSPSTCPDYQCEFAQYQQLATVLTGVFAIQVQWSQMLIQPAVLQASQPSCAVWGVSDCWQLRAEASRVLLLCGAHTSLAASKQGAVLPLSWRHLDNSVAGHMYCMQGDLRDRGLLPEISSGGCLKAFSIHWITPILQDDTENRGNY